MSGLVFRPFTGLPSERFQWWPTARSIQIPCTSSFVFLLFLFHFGRAPYSSHTQKPVFFDLKSRFDRDFSNSAGSVYVLYPFTVMERYCTAARSFYGRSRRLAVPNHGRKRDAALRPRANQECRLHCVLRNWYKENRWDSWVTWQTPAQPFASREWL